MAFASRVSVRTIQPRLFDNLRKKMKEILGDRVQEVIVSKYHISSPMPCSIMFRNDVLYLEINPHHPTIESLSDSVNEGSQNSLFGDLVISLFDIAQLRAKDLLKKNLNIE